jgi:hypothetical protein
MKPLNKKEKEIEYAIVLISILVTIILILKTLTK